MSLNHRHLEPEIIDDLTLESPRHIQALRGLERINQWSLSSKILWNPILTLSKKMIHEKIRILDIATGAGDIPIQLWKKFRQSGLTCQIDGCDRSQRAVMYARKQAESKKAEVRFFKLDVCRDPLPTDYHILMSSLFLHHLSGPEALAFLTRITEAASRAVLINDLIRNWQGVALAYLGTRFLTSSDVVHKDGPQSVRAAFTIEEVQRLAEEAGLRGFQISRHWPSRFLFFWQKK